MVMKKDETQEDVLDETVSVADPEHVLARDTIQELKALGAELNFGSVEATYQDGTLGLRFTDYTGSVPGSEPERSERINQPLKRSLSSIFAADEIGVKSDTIDGGYVSVTLRSE